MDIYFNCIIKNLFNLSRLKFLTIKIFNNFVLFSNYFLDIKLGKNI